MDLGHMNVVLKWMYLYVGSGLRNDKLYFLFFDLVSTQLAFRVQPRRTQAEAQYWGNPKVARLEGTPTILFQV